MQTIKAIIVLLVLVIIAVAFWSKIIEFIVSISQ
jgi:hypothetical protein